MDGDEVNSLDASIAWFDATAFDAECLPVESLDFGLLTGDVVPRDGMQRPFLTSGSPTHAPAARRGSKQPTHITHVHQTIIQSCIPTTTCAHIATTAVQDGAMAYGTTKNITHKKVGGQQLSAECMFCGTVISSTDATRVVEHFARDTASDMHEICCDTNI